jgi:hypothetical protein
MARQKSEQMGNVGFFRRGGTLMTRRSFILLTLAVLGAAGTSLFMPASSLAAQKKETDNSWVVVKITGGKNGDEYKAISATQVNSEKKRLKDENKKAKDAWKDAKKIDPKAEQPVPLRLTVVKKGFKTQKGAKDCCDKMAEEAKNGSSDDSKDDSKDEKKSGNN